MRSESSDHHQKDIVKQLKKSNFYEILDVKNNATDSDIKKSFKKMALKYHPDKNTASYSKEVFHKISQAYDTLSDPSKRNAYDEKQDKINMKTQFRFSNQNQFFHDSSNFDSAFGNRFFHKPSQFEKKYSNWSAEFKMDEKARRQRQWFRKSREKNTRDQGNKQNQSFITKANSKNSSFQKPSTSDKKQKQSWQDSFKRQSENFNFFQKPTFKKAESYTTDYEEIRRQMERKQRLQKQKEKANKNLRTFMMFVMIIVAWLTFQHLGPMMKGIPVYSMHASQAYKIPRLTKELHTPFYVTEDYVQRVQADDRFREYLDRKIDVVYIKSLSRVCNTMIQKQQELQNNLSIAKSKKSKKSIHHQLQKLDMSSCDKVHEIREKNPPYFKSLFLDPKTKQQML